jgi:hypothetical protein
MLGKMTLGKTTLGETMLCKMTLGKTTLGEMMLFILGKTTFRQNNVRQTDIVPYKYVPTLMPKIDFSFAGRRQISNQPPRRRLHRQDQGNAGRGDAGTDVMIF